MTPESAYLNLVLADIATLEARIRLLKQCFASQKVCVRVQHCGELDCVHKRFGAFKALLEHGSDDWGEPVQDIEAIVVAYNELILAVDTLLEALGKDRGAAHQLGILTSEGCLPACPRRQEASDPAAVRIPHSR